MARALRVLAHGPVGQVRVVSAPWCEIAFIRGPRMALAVHDVPLRAPPQWLMRWPQAQSPHDPSTEERDVQRAHRLTEDAVCIGTTERTQAVRQP